MARYLVDTCVWIDYLEDEGSCQHLRQSAEIFFRKVIDKRYDLFMAECTLFELKKKFSDEQIANLMLILNKCGLLKRLRPTAEQITQAEKLAQKKDLPKNDCLIAIQARDNSAVVITQDKHLLLGLVDVASAIRPQDVI